MALWYYVVGQERNGPVSEGELRALIDSGEFSSDTLVWRKGMDNWEAAGVHPDLSDAFVSPPPIPSIPVEDTSNTVPEQDPVPTVPPPAFEMSEKVGGAPLTSRPWPRFWARYIDNFIFTPLLGFGIAFWSVLNAPSIYIKIVSMNEIVFGLMVLPLVSLLLAISMTLFGTTPGKAIVGVRVPVPSGSNRFLFYLLRELRVWAIGLGFGVPFIALFTQVAQYRRLAAGRPASYDDGNPAIIANPSKMRLAVAVCLGFLIFLGNSVLQMEDRKASNDIASNQIWTSPVTGEKAVFSKIWKPEPIETSSGQAFYFVADELLLEAIFGHEPLPPEGMEAMAYANAIKEAIATGVTIKSEWKPVTIHGMQGLRASGHPVSSPDIDVEVTVVIRGRDAWRTLMFTRGSTSEQLAERDRFVSAMFGTTY